MLLFSFVKFWGEREEGNSGSRVFQILFRPISCAAKGTAFPFAPFRGTIPAIHLFPYPFENFKPILLPLFPANNFLRDWLPFDPFYKSPPYPAVLCPALSIPRECRVMLSFEPSCLGGCHIIVFGVPSSRRNRDRPATIRDSSRFFTVGSKILASSPTSQGIRSPGQLFDFRINHLKQPARSGLNTLPKNLLPFYGLEIVIGDVQSRQDRQV